jgi:hypothetical protein
VHCRWRQVGTPASTTTDRATGHRRRRRPGSRPALEFFERRRASRRVPVVRRQSRTDRTRPMARRSRFGCPAHTAPSARATWPSWPGREPGSICRPRYHPPTRRPETPRRSRAPPTPGEPRHRGPPTANPTRSPLAYVDPPEPAFRELDVPPCHLCRGNITFAARSSAGVRQFCGTVP